MTSGGEAAFEVVDHRKHTQHHTLSRVLDELFALTKRALAIVVEVSAKEQVLLLLILQLSRELVDLSLKLTLFVDDFYFGFSRRLFRSLLHRSLSSLSSLPLDGIFVFLYHILKFGFQKSPIAKSLPKATTTQPLSRFFAKKACYCAKVSQSSSPATAACAILAVANSPNTAEPLPLIAAYCAPIA